MAHDGAQELELLDRFVEGLKATVSLIGFDLARRSTRVRGEIRVEILIEKGACNIMISFIRFRAET